MEYFFQNNQYLLSFRITHNIWSPSNNQYADGKFSPYDEKDNGNYELEYYIINIKNYLKEKGYTISSSIGGLHINAKNPHIHYHLVIQGKSYPANWIQNWKYYFQNRPTLPSTVAQQTQSLSLHIKPTGKSKLNISIKGTICNSQNDLNNYLAYPLKEGKYLVACLHNLDSSFHYLQELGTTLYKKACAVRAAQERGETRRLSLYTRVTDYIDSILTLDKDYYAITLNVLEHFRTLEKKEQIHPRQIVNICQTYLYHLGILTNEQILEKYNI